MTKLFNFLVDNGIKFEFVPGSRHLNVENVEMRSFVNFHIHGSLSFNDIKFILDDNYPFNRIYAHNEDLIIEFFV